MKALPYAIIGVDPGDTTGIAVFSGNGVLVSTGQHTVTELIKWVNAYLDPISVLVVEDYRIYSRRAIQQSGSKVGAAQVIGIMKLWAVEKGAYMVLQGADLLPTASKISGVKMPSKHSVSHWVSAFNHAYLWMFQAGIVKSALDIERHGNG